VARAPLSQPCRAAQPQRAVLFEIDLTALKKVISIDHDTGLLPVEGGIQWPALIDGYLQLQRAAFPLQEPRWGIAQKQTGGDNMSIGGALAANAHGRGLTMAPMVADVESFSFVSPDGDLVDCSRDRNPNLFRLAIGGYGLFGPIAIVTLRLVPRR
jgi:FAD/FMN-containing dehydrogenase